MNATGKSVEKFAAGNQGFPPGRGSSRSRNIGYRVSRGMARRVLLNTLSDLVRQMRAAHTLSTVSLDGDYHQPDGWEQPTAGPLTFARATFVRHALALAADVPDFEPMLVQAVAAAGVVADTRLDLVDIWSAVSPAATALASALPGLESPDADCDVEARHGGLHFRLRVNLADPPGGRDIAADAHAFLKAAAALGRDRRNAGRRPTLSQLIVEQAAFHLLSTDGRVDSAYRTWGTSGFREHQTYMSITDPGVGHLDGTLRDRTYLDGVIVHIEHLERGSQDRDRVEPYRIPFPPVVPRIRLLLGDDAPASSYVGRPVFEHGAPSGLLKTVHTVAAACSELFAQGLTECKIAIEGMTATQAIAYMRALAAAVRRDPTRQLLSAAFNLNTPLVDDRERAREGTVESMDVRFRSGLLGIELADAGGFDKVTWDGTGDSYPSRCVLEQITTAQAVTLVHRAHERGLLTYFSAGFRFEHLVDAVETGVDGVGVGGAQILRYLDRRTGNHGPFVPANIAKILRLRDRGERGVRGQAAAQLAALDRQYFELSLTSDQEGLRRALFDALSSPSTSPADLAGLVQHAIRLRPRSTSTDPLLGWVERLEMSEHESLLARSVADAQGTIAHLRAAADDDDRELLAEELTGLRASNALRTTGRAA